MICNGYKILGNLHRYWLTITLTISCLSSTSGKPWTSTVIETKCWVAKCSRLIHRTPLYAILVETTEDNTQDMGRIVEACWRLTCWDVEPWVLWFEVWTLNTNCAHDFWLPDNHDMLPRWHSTLEHTPHSFYTMPKVSPNLDLNGKHLVFFKARLTQKSDNSLSTSIKRWPLQKQKHLVQLSYMP